MLINYENLKTSFEGFQALYKGALITTVPPKWPQIAMRAPSTGPQETYEWLSRIPAVREWLGDRHIKELAGFKYTIVNKDWESTIEVDRNQFEDDKLGLFNPAIQSMPGAYYAHQDKLIFELLKNGFTTLGPDGSFFFVATHSESGTNQSNLDTAAYSLAAIEAGLAKMMAFTFSDGEACEIMPDVLVVHPTNYLQALKDVSSPQLIAIGMGASAVVQGGLNVLATFGVKVIPSARVGSNDWFWLATQYPIKPLIMQIRREAEFNQLTDQSSLNVFMQKKFLYGIDARYNVGYGPWQLAYGSTGGS